MSKEKKIVELNDEELSKVSGGGVPTNANGEYVITQYDWYRQKRGEIGSSAPVNIYALESKITSNIYDSVFVYYRQAGGLGGISVGAEDKYVTISYLINNFDFVENTSMDPHLI